MTVAITKVYLEVDNLLFEQNMIAMQNTQEMKTAKKCKLISKTLSGDGCDMHYVVSDTKHDKSIVFLHPAFADNSIFADQFDYFSDEYTVIGVDLIGHGKTQTDKSSIQIDASREYIARILETEGIEKTNIVGVSVGSLIAQHFALEYPEKVNSITALGGYDINETNTEIAKTQRLSNIGLVIRALLSMRAFRKKAAEISCASERGQAMFYTSSKHYTRRSFSKMQGLSKVVKDREQPEIDYPTLILTAEHDIDLAKRMAEQWHSKTENSKYFLIEGAGHCANVDRPKEFNTVLKGFLDRTN